MSRNRRGSYEKSANGTPSERPDLLLKGAVLRRPSGRWPSGTEGTIVEAFEDGAIVEIADDDGCTLAMLPLPYDALVIGDSWAG